MTLKEWAIAQWNRFNPAYSEKEVPEWLDSARDGGVQRAYISGCGGHGLECENCPIQSECVDALEHPCDKLMDDLEVRAQELYEEESKQVLTMWLEGKI